MVIKKSLSKAHGTNGMRRKISKRGKRALFKVNKRGEGKRGKGRGK